MATNTLSDQELLDLYEKSTGKKFDLTAPIPEDLKSPEAIPSAEPSSQGSPIPVSSPSPEVSPSPAPSPSPISDLELIKRAEKASLSDYYKQLDVQEGPPKDYLLALETGLIPEFGPKSVPFGPAETAARTLRSAAAGFATEALSEPYFGAFGAMEQMKAGELLDIIFTHPGLGTKEKIGLYQKFQDAYSKDLARQRQFKEEDPYAAILAEGLGMSAGISKLSKPVGATLEVGEQAIKPAYEMLAEKFPSLVSKPTTTEAAVLTPLARLGMGKEFSENLALPGDKAVTVAQNVGQMLKGAAAQAVAMQSGSEFAKATTSQAEPTSEQIKNIVAAGITAPVASIGIGGLAVGTELGVQAGGAALKKVGLSKPAKMFYNLLFGPTVRSQEKFLEVERELEKISSSDDVKQFYESLREYILNKQDWSVSELEKAKTTMAAIYNRLPSVKAEAKAEQLKLAEEKREALLILRVKIDDIIDQLKVPVAGEEGKIQKMGKIVDLTPHAENLIQNLQMYRDQLVKQSQDAVDLIHPDTVVTADQLIKIFDDQIKKLSITGLEKGTAIGDTKQEAIRLLQAKIEKIKKDFSVGEGGMRVLQGVGVKDAVKDLQADYQRVPVADFNEAYQAAINAASGELNLLLKEQNPLYAEAMVPIAEGFELLRKFRPIVGAKDQNLAYERAKFRYKQAALDKVYQEQLEKLARNIGDSSILDGVEELKLAKMAGTPEAKMAAIQSNPILEKARMAESLLRATASRQKAMELRMKYPDDPNVQEIANLWDEYTSLIDPQVIKSAQDKSVEKFAAQEIAPQAFLEESARKRVKKYEEIGKAFKSIEGGSFIEKFLRNFKKDSMTDNAANIVDRISKLDPEEFSEFFKTINLRNPEDFKRLVELMRIQKDIDTPNIAGSRRVIFLKSLLTVALGAKSGYETDSLLINPGIGAAVGATMGMAFDNYGPKIAQSWLRNLNRIEGIPSYKKMLNSFPFVPDDQFRSVLGAEVASYVQNVKPDQYSFVSADMIPSLVRDVHASDMSALKKSKITNELAKTGTIKGEDLIHLTLEGIGQVTKPKPMAVKLIEAEKPKSVRQDRPDVLNELVKKGKK